MKRALDQASKSYTEGGCPIGGVLVDNETGQVLGEGHNALVQEANPILHGEMAALRDAGRMVNRHNATMYTTLQPCFMCAGAITQFGIPRVVIGDVVNTSSNETLRFLRTRGIEVIVMDPNTRSVVARRLGRRSKSCYRAATVRKRSSLHDVDIRNIEETIA
jgi:cytosine/creatinine deaminase